MYYESFPKICWYEHTQGSTKMSFLLMFVTVLHLVTLAILFIATMEKSWWTLGDTGNSDLWYKCSYDNASGTWLCASVQENEWLQSVQALMILSVVLSSISFMVFLGQLFTMSKGGLFYFTGLCQFFAGFAAFAAVLIYTFQRSEILQDVQELEMGRFGYCYILAWVCVPLLLISGALYVHLRKRA
ncbi:peripheral myelin protein [Pimephales promelas]|nr:peripheral myelin protein [Pimephales promelas]